MEKFITKPPFGFGYNNISIIPKVSNIKPKSVSLRTYITKKIEVPNPFIASPMDSVIGIELSKMILSSGSLAILPPYYNNMDQLKKAIDILYEYNKSSKGVLGLAISPNISYINKLDKILSSKVRVVALDTLHQEPDLHLQALKYLKKNYPNLEVISGNVVCAEDCLKLIDAGADSIRVGMTEASINNGLDLTGCGRKQGSAVLECAKVCKKYNIPLIADGGIKQISHAALALSLGADCVMMGSMFASLQESNGETIKSSDGKLYKIYTGMSRPGCISAELIPEGSQKKLKISGSFNELIPQWCNTLKISISRSGCNSINDFKNNSSLEFFI